MWMMRQVGALLGCRIAGGRGLCRRPGAPCARPPGCPPLLVSTSIASAGGPLHEGVPGAVQEAHHLPRALGCAAAVPDCDWHRIVAHSGWWCVQPMCFGCAVRVASTSCAPCRERGRGGGGQPAAVARLPARRRDPLLRHPDLPAVSVLLTSWLLLLICYSCCCAPCKPLLAMACFRPPTPSPSCHELLCSGVRPEAGRLTELPPTLPLPCCCTLGSCSCVPPLPCCCTSVLLTGLPSNPLCCAGA